MAAKTRKWIQLILCTIAASFFFLVGAATASETIKGAENGNQGLSPAAVMDLADRWAAAGRAVDAVTLLNALTGDPDVEVRSEARFRLAALYRQRGNLPLAVRLYREILDERPSALPVRLELAEILAQLGEDDRARRELRQARAIGLPTDVARLVDQFALALRSRKRLGASTEIGIAPDTNINRATSKSMVRIGSLPFQLSEDARAQSGLGLTLRGHAFWRPRLSETTNMLFSLSGSGNIYGKSEFNDAGGSFSGGPEFFDGQTRWRPGLVIGKRWFGGHSYSTSTGGTVNFLKPIGRRSQIEVDISAIRARYQRNPSLSGYQYSMLSQYEYALSTRVFGRVSARYERQLARDDAYTNSTIGGELLVSAQTGRQTIYGRLGYYRTVAKEEFAFLGNKRNDRLLDSEIGILLRQWQWLNMSPVIRIGRTVNRSPIFFYDFRRWRFEAALSREF